MKPRRIVCAAIKGKDGTIICGARHFDVIMRAHANANYRGYGVEQGFIDNFGEFLNRKDAYNIALSTNQILYPLPGREGTLFSENLY